MCNGKYFILCEHKDSNNTLHSYTGPIKYSKDNWLQLNNLYEAKNATQLTIFEVKTIIAKDKQLKIGKGFNYYTVPVNIILNHK